MWPSIVHVVSYGNPDNFMDRASREDFCLAGPDDNRWVPRLKQCREEKEKIPLRRRMREALAQREKWKRC
jgi:hypothetical protein